MEEKKKKEIEQGSSAVEVNGVSFAAELKEILIPEKYAMASKAVGEMIGEKVLLISGPLLIVFMLSGIISVDVPTTFEVGGLYVSVEVLLVDVILAWVLVGYFLIPLTSIKSEPLFSEKGKRSIMVYAFMINAMGCVIAAFYKYSEEKLAQ